MELNVANVVLVFKQVGLPVPIAAPIMYKKTIMVVKGKLALNCHGHEIETDSPAEGGGAKRLPHLTINAKVKNDIGRALPNLINYKHDPPPPQPVMAYGPSTRWSKQSGNTRRERNTFWRGGGGGEGRKEGVCITIRAR